MPHKITTTKCLITLMAGGARVDKVLGFGHLRLGASPTADRRERRSLLESKSRCRRFLSPVCPRIIPRAASNTRGEGLDAREDASSCINERLYRYFCVAKIV